MNNSRNHVSITTANSNSFASASKGKKKRAQSATGQRAKPDRAYFSESAAAPEAAVGLITS